MAVAAGFQDVAAMGKAIEQGRGHVCVPEHRCPFAEAQVGVMTTLVHS